MYCNLLDCFWERIWFTVSFNMAHLSCLWGFEVMSDGLAETSSASSSRCMFSCSRRRFSLRHLLLNKYNHWVSYFNIHICKYFIQYKVFIFTNLSLNTHICEWGLESFFFLFLFPTWGTTLIVNQTIWERHW